MPLPELKTHRQGSDPMNMLSQMAYLSILKDRKKLSDYEHGQKKAEAERQASFQKEFGESDYKPGEGPDQEALKGLYKKYPDLTEPILEQERKQQTADTDAQNAATKAAGERRQRAKVMEERALDAIGTLDPNDPDIEKKYKAIRTWLRNQSEELAGDRAEQALKAFDANFPEEYDEKAQMLVESYRKQYFGDNPVNNEYREVKTRDKDGKEIIETYIIRPDGSKVRIATADRWEADAAEGPVTSDDAAKSYKRSSDIRRQQEQDKRAMAQLDKMDKFDAMAKSMLDANPNIPQETKDKFKVGDKIPEDIRQELKAAEQKKLDTQQKELDFHQGIIDRYEGKQPKAAPKTETPAPKAEKKKGWVYSGGSFTWSDDVTSTKQGKGASGSWEEPAESTVTESPGKPRFESKQQAKQYYLDIGMPDDDAEEMAEAAMRGGQ